MTSTKSGLRPPPSRSYGFTLVELLVVIAIVGILIAMLLPAVNAAREAARRAQCQNNLRQLALAVQLHENTYGYFPPARRGTRLHPSGIDQYAVSWGFLLLPFLEEQAMYDSFVPEQRVDAEVNSVAMRTPVSTFFCPTRRGPIADRDFDDDEAPSKVRGVGAAGDYAANSGTSTRHGMPGRDRLDRAEFGPVYTLSRIKPRQVTDGISKTYVFGEKFLPPIRPGGAAGTEHLRQGDVAFFTGDARHTIVRRSSAGFPRDSDDDYPGQFGSAHSNLTHFAFLDASVHAIEHNIDVDLLKKLSAIGDGGNIPDDVFDD